MKKILFALIVAAVGVVGLSAQRDPFFPPTATTLGQGGAFTANAEGFNAFFYNPAGFNRKKEFTLASINVYGVMDKTIFDILWSQLFKGTANPLNGGSHDLQSRDAGFDLSNLGLGDAGAALQGLQSDFTDVGNYLSAAETTNPGVVSQALGGIISNMISQGTLPSDLQSIATELTSNPGAIGSMSDLLAEIAPALLANASTIDQIVAALIDNSSVQTAAAAQGASPPAHPSIDKALKTAFPSGNLNAGAMLGLGWVGGGLGVGLFANAEAGIYTPEGQNLLAAQGRVLNTITLAGGLAFRLFDGFDIGFSVRPTILGFASVNVSDFLGVLLGGASGDVIGTVLNGGIYKAFRLGVDVGALWDIGPFTLGAAIKDLIPFPMTYLRFDNYLDYFSSLTKNSGGTAITAEEAQAANLYNPLIPKLNVGVQFHPDLGAFKFVLDPRVGLDIYDVLGVLELLQEKGTQTDLAGYNFLKTVNLGAEVKLLNTVAVRAGINRGAFTGGLGVRLLFADLNVAVSAALGPKASDPSTVEFTQVGFATEFAIRF